MATIHHSLLEKPINSHCKSLSLIILTFTAIISSASLIAIHFQKPTSSNSPTLPQSCIHAQNQESCIVLLSELLAPHEITGKKGIDLLQIFLEKSVSKIRIVIQKGNNIKRWINNRNDEAILVDCLELMDLSVDRVMDSVFALKNRGVNGLNHDAHTWLSTVLTNHVTCLDGLKGSTQLIIMNPWLKDLISRAKTALALLVAVSPAAKDEVMTLLNGEFPAWVGRDDRRLLMGSVKEINANVVVAKDGTGNFKTVNEAVASAPDNGKTRYVIYVKKGTYKETVAVGKTKKNVMLTGDGMNKTIITGSLNVVDGSTTFNSATVAAVGDGFIAQDIWFQNTAGPQKHQAVALRVGSDKSVINRCRIDAYQDTLYTHSNRQFYRDSNVTGTVDFIFGNAAVVFQKCKLIARKPMDGQKNMVTAQGRTDPNQNTGTSIQLSEIISSPDLEPIKRSIKSYLGRPWKEYSRTVVMQSAIGDFIDPAGWAVWSGDFALKTLYYGEYLNRGPGAGTSKRVTWVGFHVITSAAEAKKFTVAELIQGGTWLKSTGVSYTEGL